MPPPPDTTDYSRRLIARDGRVLVAPSDEVYQAALARRDAGGEVMFTADTPEAEAARAERREYGGRPIAAGAAGTARGLTFGVSDLAAVGIGGEDARSLLRGLEEHNPEASAIGEVTGAVAPILLSGGVASIAEAGAALGGRGLLRGALGAATLPTRAVAGLAERAGGAAARGLLGAGGGAGRRITRAALGTAVEGAIDGAATEAGSMLSERALGTGDPNLTAELALARLGTGALLGGTAGGVLGGGVGALGAGGRAAREASAAVLGRGWRGVMGTELSPRVAAAWAAASDAGDEGAAAIRRFGSPTEEGRRLRRLVERGDAVYEDAEVALRGALNVEEEAFARTRPAWMRGLRMEEMAGLVDGTRLADQAAAARGLVSSLRDRLETLISDFRGTDIAGRAAPTLRRAEAWIRDMDPLIRPGALPSGAEGARAAARINADLNSIKGEVQDLMARARGMGPAAEAVGEIETALRNTLEDGALWGERAAVAQREINAAWSRLLTTRRAYNNLLLENGATLASRPDWNPYDSIPQADSRRVHSFLSGLGVTANDTAEATFRETRESMRQLLDVMERHLQLDPAARAAITEARRQGALLDDIFTRSRADAVDLNQWRHLDSNRALGRAVLGGIVGTTAGGPVLGLALTALTQPTQVIRGLGLLERWTTDAASSIGDGLGDFIAAGRAAARTGRGRVRTATVAGSVRAYQERIARLEEESSRPAERAAASTAGMDLAPRTRDAMVRTATRANAFLNSVRPRGGLPGEIHPTVRLPASWEIARFLRQARAVDDPLTVIEDLQNGDINPDAVAALQQVYPRLYAQIRSEAIRHLAEEAGPIDHRSLVQLGALLGIPTTPSLTPELMAVMQAAWQPQGPTGTPPTPSPRPATRLAEGWASGVDSLESRRAVA